MFVFIGSFSLPCQIHKTLQTKSRDLSNQRGASLLKQDEHGIPSKKGMETQGKSVLWVRWHIGILYFDIYKNYLRKNTPEELFSGHCDNSA